MTFLFTLLKPKNMMLLGAQLRPWIGFITLLCFCIGIYGALFVIPADYQQGELVRILYVHVPASWGALFLYVWIGIFSALGLITRMPQFFIMARSIAPIGLVYCLLSLITGSIWGKPTWGAFWVWDARLTSELILLFLYGAILAVSNAYQHQDQRDRLVAILTLVGLVDLPIIHYSVYWWNTLHQGATFLTLAKPKIHISMAYPLIFTLLGFSFYCILMVLKNARNDLLLRERLQSWVKDKVASR